MKNKIITSCLITIIIVIEYILIDITINNLHVYWWLGWYHSLYPSVVSNCQKIMLHDAKQLFIKDLIILMLSNSIVVLIHYHVRTKNNWE